MVIASKVHALRLLHSPGEVKPGIDKAFAGGLGDREDNWAAGVYKSSKGLVLRPKPASSLSFPGAALETPEDGLPIQTKSEAVGLGLGDYKDLIAKSATPEKSSCGAWAIVSECESGEHHFAKKLLCGKEWCSVCGEDDSAAHKRRQARILPKIQQISQLGYFVIEWPDWARHIGQRGIMPDLDHAEYIAGWCASKADLRTTTNTIVDILAGKRCGRRGRVDGYFTRGVGRWHWFGEQCPGKWNPHFNVMVESSYMPKLLLEKIKADLRAALNCPDLIVHYSYFDKPGQMFQKLRYVARATFRDDSWNPYMARELFNFRNVRWWGNWKGEPAWELCQAEVQSEDVAGLQMVSNLQEGVCPDCGRPLRVLYHDHKTGKPVQWSRPVDSVYLNIWSAQEIAGSGYFRIPHREWFGYSFSPGELLRLQELEVKVRASPSVLPAASSSRKQVNDYWQHRRGIWDELQDMGFSATEIIRTSTGHQ